MSSQIDELKKDEVAPKVLLKINYGCGETKLEDFINVDTEINTQLGNSVKYVQPDVVCDIRKGQLPFLNESCELIHMIHALEHLELKYWPILFYEFNRILIPEGELRLAYPEFERCAIGFIENTKGMRDFWRRTLYGRQLYPGDYHIVPMRTAEVIDHLLQAGFHEIKSCPEPEQEYNTFLTAHKGKTPLIKADLLRREIFER